MPTAEKTRTVLIDNMDHAADDESVLKKKKRTHTRRENEQKNIQSVLSSS